MRGEGFQAGRRDQARRHDLRLKILALVAQDRHRSLDPEDLSRLLPDHPAATVVEYHLAVLRRVDLLPLRVTD